MTLAFPDHSTAALKLAANFDRIASSEQRAAIVLLVAALATPEECERYEQPTLPLLIETAR